MFPHIHISAPPPAVPTTTPSASARIQGVMTAEGSDKSKSAPNVIQEAAQPKTHQYSATRPKPKEKSEIPVRFAYNFFFFIF